MTIQGTPEWFAERLGKVTASRVSDVVARTKSGWSASRANYMAQLVSERLTGEAPETFKSAAMERGSELEEEARNAYQFLRDMNVDEVGFVDHPTIKMAGASPDGLAGPDGLAEFKCPNTATHIETLRGGSIKKTYRDQIQWQMACTGRAWCDFVSYDPRLPVSMRLHVTRVEADREYIAELEAEISAFLSEVDATVAELLTLYPIEKVAA